MQGAQFSGARTPPGLRSEAKFPRGRSTQDRTLKNGYYEEFASAEQTWRVVAETNAILCSATAHNVNAVWLSHGRTEIALTYHGEEGWYGYVLCALSPENALQVYSWADGC